jgi:hypothetical protein
MDVHDIWSLAGGILALALAATFLTKPNTAADVNAVGGQFTSAIKTAEAG